MTGHLSHAAQAWGSLSFILFNADLFYPLVIAIIGFVPLVIFKDVRNALASPRSLTVFLAVFLMWVLLIPWSDFWLVANAGFHPRLQWPQWAAAAVFFSWPVVAFVLLVSAKGARIPLAVYVLFNAPGWLLASFVCGMAVSGDWI